MQFEFLKSVRFWKMFVIVVAEFLGSQGVIDQNLAHAIAVWLGGSVAIRTIDRLGENISK